MGLKCWPKAARPEAAVRCSSSPNHRKAALLISSIVSSDFLYFCHRLEHSEKQLCLTSGMVGNGQGAITTAIPTRPGEVRSQSGPCFVGKRAVGCGLWGHEVTWVSFQSELKLRKIRIQFLSRANRLHTSLIAEGRGGEGHTISLDQRGTQGILNPNAGSTF